MAVTGFGPVVNFPSPPLRPWGLLLDESRKIDLGKRFPLGIRFQGFDYQAMLSNDVDCTPSGMQDPHGFTAVITQPAFSLYDGVICSTLYKTDEEVSAAVEARWPLLLSYMMARELLTSNASGGHSLQDDDTPLAATATPEAGISLLEATLATGLKNGQGMIHVTPSALAWLVTNGTVNLRSGIYYSPGGHIVIADAGYQVTETTTTTMYATAPIYWDMTDPKDLSTPGDASSIDFTRNTVQGLQEAYAIFVFDPTLVWSTVATKA